MTYGCGKSDSAILAGKPTNKAEQSAAESVERRVEAKGNTGQQSTYRAQERESVSQALDRIRQVARHRKKELLREAFFELKENAAPGVDGLRWQNTRQISNTGLKICTHDSVLLFVASGQASKLSAGSRPAASPSRATGQLRS